MARQLRPTLGSGAGPILIGAALIALAGVALLLVQTCQGRAAARDRGDEELVRAYAVQSRLLSERLARQEIGAVALAGETATWSDPDAAELPRWFQNEFDLAAVVSVDGNVVVGGERLPGEPSLLASRFGSGSGLVAHDGALHLVAGQEVPGSEPRLVALVGERLDVPFAREVGDAITVDLAWVLAEASGPMVAASTLSRPDTEALPQALRRLGDWSVGLERARRARLELGGASYDAMLSPLRSGDEVLGAVVTMSRGDTLPMLTRRTRRSTLGLGLLGLALGTAIAVLGTRRQLRPVLALTETLRETSSRCVGGTARAASDDPETLASIAAAVRRRLRAEQARGGLSERAADTAAGRQPVGHGTRLAAGPGVVLAFDLRRFAPTAAARHPDLALARYGGDRDLMARAMAARGGELVAVAGHRLLGVFPRESAPEALFAAVEIGGLLQRTDSVFDEPVPPAVALAAGDLVRGRVGEGLRAQRAVLGRAVQETDALLREAMPGDLVFSGSVRDDLVEPLAEAGIPIAEQRAVLFPRPIHRVDLAGAATALGVRAAPTAPPLAPGILVGDRFELDGFLRELPEGRLYAARDRETGAPAEILALEGDVPVERLSTLIERGRSLPPTIVGLLDSGLFGETPFLATSSVAGPSLAAVVEAGGPLPAPVAAELGVQIARALAAIHRADLTHPGLRPERIVVGLDGLVRLRWVGLETVVSAQSVGSEDAAFRAPEASADPSADLYAWAAVTRFALIGAGPQSGDLAAATQAPASLLRAITRCLAPDPASRSGSVGELLRELSTDDDSEA